MNWNAGVSNYKSYLEERLHMIRAIYYVIGVTTSGGVTLTATPTLILVLPKFLHTITKWISNWILKTCAQATCPMKKGNLPVNLIKNFVT